MDHLQPLRDRLRTPSLRAQSFFQAPGTAQQVLNNIDTFVVYSRKHPSFIKQTIALALNTSYIQLEDPLIKTAAHAATEVLCSEETVIAELFFEENIEDIPDESPLAEEEETSWDIQGELQRHELVAQSLLILSKPQSNETCLGYLQKLFGFLIRHNAEPVLAYFSTHPEQLDLLLANLRYSSVSTLVGQLLTSEDRTKSYRHETLKWRVMEFVVGELVDKAEDWEAFDGAMVLVEDILNTTKQAYYEYFQDFKRAANLLVSQGVMSRFFDIILQRNEPTFRSASLFLELLFTRINLQTEDNSYYHRGEQQEPSMNFQIDIFLQNMPALFDLVAHIESFQSLAKISYLSFLEGLFKCACTRGIPFSLCQPAFIELLDSLNRQAKAGVYRNKMYHIITGIIANAHPQEVARFLQLNENLWGRYFQSIRSANYANTKAYNMNETSAFDVGLIQQLAKKQPNIIPNASAVIGKDFKRICKKYQTKVASFQNSNTNFPGEEEISFEISPMSKSIPSLSLDLINKNIVVAMPGTSTNQANSSKQANEKPQILKIDDLEEVEQIQQVIVLTDTLNTQPSTIVQALSAQQSQSEKQANIKNSISNLPATAKQALLKIKDKLGGQVDRVRYFAKHLSIFG